MYCILFTFGWMRFCFHTATPQGRHKHAMRPTESHCVVFHPLFFPSLSSITMKWLSTEWGRNTRRRRCFRLAKRFVASAAGCSWRSGCVPVLSTADHSQNAVERTLAAARRVERSKGGGKASDLELKRSGPVCFLPAIHPTSGRSFSCGTHAAWQWQAGSLKKRLGGGSFFIYLFIFSFCQKCHVMQNKITQCLAGCSVLRLTSVCH